MSGNDRSGSSRRNGLSKSDYLERLASLQVELVRLARWLDHTGKRLVVVFEGRDSAGKGGVINAISERLNPRLCHVAALAAPSEKERRQWYFQRYIAHLPAAGEMTLFDRSWYNRAGVERVMGFCTPADADRFLVEVPAFERMLIDDGILLLKYWLTVDQREQEERFVERLNDPMKRWKLSPVDLRAREQYAEYGAARDRMLLASHRPWAPWTVVDFNHQRRGRLALIHHLLAALPIEDVPDAPLTMPPLDGDPGVESLPPGFTPLQYADK